MYRLSTHRFLSPLLAVSLLALGPARADNPLAPPRRHGAPPSYEELKLDIKKHQIRSSEQFLYFLARRSRYQDLFQQVVLERKSGAIHKEEVSAEFPRIVLGAGNLILHLTGNPDAKGSQLIEIAELAPDSSAPLFHLINFAFAGSDEMFFDDPVADQQDQTLLEHRLRRYQDTTGGGLVSCDACHATGFSREPRLDLALNWAPQFASFQVFGFQEDRILKGSVEAAAFEKFLATYNDPQKGRLYRALSLKFVKDVAGNWIFPARPVSRFSRHAEALARRRMAEEIFRFSRYPQFSYSLVAALLDCGELRSYLPPQVLREQEDRLRMVESLPNSVMVDLAHIRADEVRPEFWARYRRGDPNVVEAPERDLLEFSKQNLLRTLQIEIRNNIEKQGEDNLEFLPSEFRLAFLESQARQLSPSYLRRLAGLKYLFLPFFPELPGQIYSFTNELVFYGDGGPAEPELFPRRGYRSQAGDETLDRLLAENLGPKFLAENPSLRRFFGNVLDPAKARVPKSAYCAVLKSRSTTALVRTFRGKASPSAEMGP